MANLKDAWFVDASPGRGRVTTVSSIYSGPQSPGGYVSSTGSWNDFTSADGTGGYQSIPGTWPATAAGDLLLVACYDSTSAGRFDAGGSCTYGGETLTRLKQVANGITWFGKVLASNHAANTAANFNNAMGAGDTFAFGWVIFQQANRDGNASLPAGVTGSATESWTLSGAATGVCFAVLSHGNGTTLAAPAGWTAIGKGGVTGLSTNPSNILMTQNLTAGNHSITVTSADNLMVDGAN